VVRIGVICQPGDIKTGVDGIQHDAIGIKVVDDSIIPGAGVEGFTDRVEGQSPLGYTEAGADLSSSRQAGAGIQFLDAVDIRQADLPEVPGKWVVGNIRRPVVAP